MLLRAPHRAVSSSGFAKDVPLRSSGCVGRRRQLVASGGEMEGAEPNFWKRVSDLRIAQDGKRRAPPVAEVCNEGRTMAQRRRGAWDGMGSPGTAAPAERGWDGDGNRWEVPTR